MNVVLLLAKIQSPVTMYGGEDPQTQMPSVQASVMNNGMADVSWLTLRERVGGILLSQVNSGDMITVRGRVYSDYVLVEALEVIIPIAISELIYAQAIHHETSEAGAVPQA